MLVVFLGGRGRVLSIVVRFRRLRRLSVLWVALMLGSLAFVGSRGRLGLGRSWLSGMSAVGYRSITRWRFGLRRICGSAFMNATFPIIRFMTRGTPLLA